MPEYQKVLQLYRSTTVWQTKGLAKAQIELHARDLHSEIQKSLLDGEPVLGRYYDELPEYRYVRDAAQGTNPYAGPKSADHIWIPGYDEFSVMPDEFNYNSAPYFRVGSEGSWVYYELTYYPFVNQEETKLGISTVFGVTYKDSVTGKLYIEWFDSASEAQAVIDNLNYTDENLENGFVAAVHQRKGVVEPIHGKLSGVNAIGIGNDAFSYVFKSASTDPTTGIDWVWDNTNSGSALPVSTPTVTSPKYYKVSGNVDPEVNGYYELQKNINVSLKLNDTTNNILEQDTNGLKTHLTLHQLTAAEVTALGEANVRDAYRLIGGTDTVIGDTIKVYKDSSLFNAYLGTMDDRLIATGQGGHATVDDVMYVWKSDGGEYRYTTTKTPDPRTDKAYIQNGEITFLFEKGEDISDFVDGRVIKVDSVDYVLQEGTTIPAPCVISGGNPTETGSHEALVFIYLLGDGTYEIVKIDIESFLQENEFGDGLIVDPSSHIVSVRLATDGGIGLKTETSGNKSLKIKIDPDNVGYYAYDGEDISGCYEYNSTNNTYVRTQDQTRDPNKTYYKSKTYLTTTSNGLKLNDDVLETETVDTIRKSLKVNGRSFKKGADGKLSAIISSSDILIAGNEMDGATTTMKKVVEVDYLETHSTVSYGKTGDLFAYNGRVFRALRDISTTVSLAEGENFELVEFDFIQYNGFVYKWDSTNSVFSKYRINDGTTVNEAISILDHLAYHIDMGQFNIPNE